MRNIDRYEDDMNLRLGNYRHPRPVRKPRGGSFSRGLLWGAVIGGVLGILFAPEKGEVTRKKIKKKAEDYEEKGKEAIEKAKVEMEKAKEKYEEIRTKAEPTIQEAREKFGEIKEKIDENKGPVMESFHDFVDEIGDEAKKIKKRYFRGVRKR